MTGLIRSMSRPEGLAPRRQYHPEGQSARRPRRGRMEAWPTAPSSGPEHEALFARGNASGRTGGLALLAPSCESELGLQAKAHTSFDLTVSWTKHRGEEEDTSDLSVRPCH